jgi:thiamine-phosphate pyrophosphorylase
VHLPGDAAPDAALQARKLFAAAGRRAVISRACHSAAEAAEDAAGLLLYAPVFEKALGGEAIPGRGLEALAEACRAAGSTPVLALGGVTVENAAACVAAGAAGVAAIRLFLGAEWRKLRSL